MCLTARKSLLHTGVNEVIVICPDLKGFRVSFKVVAEGFKGMDDGKEFFVMNVIILFCGKEQLGEIGNWVPAIEKVGLFQNSTHGEITCICD
jgi:hypothetical protein